MKSLQAIAVFTGFLLVLAACSNAGAPEISAPPVVESPVEATRAPVDPTTSAETEPPHSAPTEAEAPEAPAPAAERPAWQQFELTDVRSGEHFRLGDLQDQVVIVETMAVWCPFCEVQQKQILEALEELGDERVIAVSLNVDPSETAEISAAHADRVGLPWRVALAGTELSSLLQAEFGPQILAPPSTPVVIIAPDGSYQLTQFGIKEADELAELVRTLLP